MTVGRIPNIEGGIQPTLLTTTGDIMYASSASNPARLGIGSSAQVLTVASGVPSWATPASGGMTLLSTTTLSGATTTISSIDQTYKDLFIIVSGMTANTGNDDLSIRPNNVTNLTNITGTRTSVVTGLNDSKINLTVSENTVRTDANNVWAVKIYNYASTTTFKPLDVSGQFVSTSGQQAIQLGGAFRSNTAISSLVFEYGGTKTFIGGTVLLYGVK